MRNDAFSFVGVYFTYHCANVKRLWRDGSPGTDRRMRYRGSNNEDAKNDRVLQTGGLRRIRDC